MSYPVPWSTDVRGKGQPQGERDRLEEVVGLGGDVPLVVIEREDGVVPALDPHVVDGVRAHGSLHVEAPPAGLLHGRREDLVVLSTEEPSIAAVRVEPGHAQPGSRAAERSHGAVHAQEGVQHVLPRHAREGLPQGHVPGEEEDLQALHAEDRLHPLDPREVRQHLRVALAGEPGRLERSLVDGAGDHARGLAPQAGLRGGAQDPEGVVPCRGRHLPPTQGPVQGNVQDGQ